MEQDYYRILGIREDASEEEIKKRYRILAKKYHPDTNPGDREAEQKFKEAGIAYATDQIIDLIANGINHIHIYSMNKPDVAAAIMSNLSDIVAAV